MIIITIIISMNRIEGNVWEFISVRDDAKRFIYLFRQNTYLQNKKHTLTCQGGTGCYRFNYQPGS